MPADKYPAQLGNPFASSQPTGKGASEGLYSSLLGRARELNTRDHSSAPVTAVVRQHDKNRLTVWERMDALFDDQPQVLHKNWGSKLDGSSLVSAIGTVEGRKIAFYGHDFTVRAGSISAENGAKLAHLLAQAAKLRIPLVGMNDSAGAYVPAGVGGLDGYAQAFCALRKLSGVVPSIMCMFGFNAGGGSYLPRQGSFVIQPRDTFFGLTGPAVVRSVLGEDVSADELGGPHVHAGSGVTDFVVADELAAIYQVRKVLRYCPDSAYQVPRFVQTSDPLDRPTERVERLLEHMSSAPAGLNTPMDIRVVIEEICDHGDYLEVQGARAANSVVAFGRVGGYVTGFVANNSATLSGQIDIAAAYKMARFIRFCNLYNIPLIFLEDTTGFLPGTEQESAGIVQAGRALLDSIIDVRTPRFLLIVRNAYGGAYASFNNYSTGADMVLALPSARVAVMGVAGAEFVYKDRLRAMNKRAAEMEKSKGAESAREWLAQQRAEMNAEYEREFMNPDRALSLGSISSVVEPVQLRRIFTENIGSYMQAYVPGPMQEVQREFH